MQRAISEQRKIDPLIAVKIGSREVAAWPMNGFRSERGVHVESYLACIGALAGYFVASS